MEKPQTPKYLVVPMGKETNPDRAHQIAIYIDASETAIVACRGLADHAQSMAAKTWEERTQHPTEGVTEYHRALVNRNAKRMEDHYAVDCNAYAGMLDALGNISHRRYLEALNDHENGADRSAELRQQDLDLFQKELEILPETTPAVAP